MIETLPRHLAAVVNQLGYTKTPGLITAANAGTAAASRAYAWADLHEKVHLDAAFFHDGVPVVGFTAQTEESGLRALRKRLWNYGRVPVLVAADKHGGAAAYDALSNPKDVSGQASLLSATRQQLADGILAVFARERVEAGDFAAAYPHNFRPDKRVDQGLLRNLRSLLSGIGGSQDRLEAVSAVIGGSLIATYLVDRHVLDEKHLKDMAGVASLEAALEGGPATTESLFRELSERFNGDIFGAIPEALGRVAPGDLSAVSALLRGDDLATGQGALWPYDFSIIPPDLVSSVYEQLLEDKRPTQATYYTPRTLVNLVLDEVVPISGEGTPRVIDLACGSGAFITEAYRRLVYRESSRLGRRLSYQELTHLLRECIFGVDINDAAASVTVFGLYLSLLEHVDPPTIWEEAVLPRLLGKNVLASDAFSVAPLEWGKFDIVVSNPPWGSILTESAKGFLSERRLEVGDRQLAQAFAWLALEMLETGGLMGLVLPAKSFLYNKSKPNRDFRLAFFTRAAPRTVVDLSPLRRDIFAGAVAPTAVIVAESITDIDVREPFLHLAVHQRPLMRVADALVIAPEEVREIPGGLAVNRPELWKILLWGSLRDLAMIDRLRKQFVSIQDVISERSWLQGQGYKVGGTPQSSTLHLQGMPVISPSSLRLLKLASQPKERFEHETLHRPRKARLFLGPKLLVSRTLPGNRPAATVVDYDAVFSSNIMSVTAGPGDLDMLRAIGAIIVSSFGQYWQFMTAASWGVERDTIEINEFFSMPTPRSLSPEQIDAVRAIYAASDEGAGDDRVLQMVDSFVSDLFGFVAADERRIQKGIKHSLGRFQRGGAQTLVADSETLEQYAETIASQLSVSLPDVEIVMGFSAKASHQLLEVRFEKGRGGAAQPISSLEAEDIDWDRLAREISPEAQTTALMAQVGGMLFAGDSVFIVKTTDADRWSYDAALDDADRLFSALAFGGDDA